MRAQAIWGAAGGFHRLDQPDAAARDVWGPVPQSPRPPDRNTRIVDGWSDCRQPLHLAPGGAILTGAPALASTLSPRLRYVADHIGIVWWDAQHTRAMAVLDNGTDATDAEIDAIIAFRGESASTAAIALAERDRVKGEWIRISAACARQYSIATASSVANAVAMATQFGCISITSFQSHVAAPTNPRICRCSASRVIRGNGRTDGMD